MDISAGVSKSEANAPTKPMDHGYSRRLHWTAGRGNLNTMEGFFGTEYMPEIQKGDILLIEDSLKEACTIERSFSSLKMASVLDKIGWLILGKQEKFDDNGTGKSHMKSC